MRFSRLSLLLPVLCAAALPMLALAAPKTIPEAFPTAQETSASQIMRQALADGKPAQLNGIRQTMLPNGLTVLTKEVHAAPVVYFAVYYKVGSEDEEVGETGMSHLMEHMMFKGTKTRGPGVISATLQENGADFNASTSFDRTEYHETLAADRLPIAMQIESDRMVNSLFNEAQHEKEMTVVRSEYEAGENNPSTVLEKATRLTAFQVMPYRWETIGFRADIENFTRDEMYAYYKNYYAPNNAVVVIVGDFNTASALAMAQKYFGSIPAHPIQQHFITPEPVQEGERRVVVRRAGSAPQILVTYHIPGLASPDRYALDVLEAVLSDGRTCRMFQDLIQSGLASDANAYDYGLRNPDLLYLSATAQPGHANAELEAALLKDIDALQTLPITNAELTRAINQAQASYIFGKDSVEQQGDQLGENAMTGDWRRGETYVTEIKKVTPADVQRVAQKYLTADNRTVGEFEPLPLAPGQAPPPPSAGGDTAPVAHFAPGLNVPRDFYRAPSVRALGGTFDAAQSVRPIKVIFANGLTVVVQPNHANPTISISGAVMTAGADADPPGQPGLADFTAALLSRGTQTRSLLDIATALENVGANVGVSAGDEYATISGESLTKDFPLLLDVLSDELQHPSFPQSQVESARAESLAGIEDARSDTGTRAEIAFSDALYPPGHPYYAPTLDQQEAALKAMTRDQLIAFHDAHYAPNKTILTIVGDIAPDAAVALVKKYFGSWPAQPGLADVAIPAVAPMTAPIKPIVIDVPDKAQADVRYGYPGLLTRRAPDFYTDVVLDTILGGGDSGLSSRLGLNVRDRLGLVYGISADNDASLGAGPFEIAFGANPANVDAAVAETLRQLMLLRKNGVTPQEVHAAVSYLTGSYPVRLSTSSAVAEQLLFAQIYALGLDYVQKHNGYYQSITPAQVNQAIQKYIRPGTGVLVIAGTYSGKYAAK